MNQPTREEIEEIKRRVARLERYTEPIKITQLEIESGSIFRMLDEVQEITNAVETKIDGVKADTANIIATHSDHSAFLVEHGERLKEIEEKQDTHTEILGQLMNFGEDQTKRFDRVDESIAELKATQNEQGAKLDLILKLLQPRQE